MRRLMSVVLTLATLLLVTAGAVPGQPESVRAQDTGCPTSTISPLSTALHVLPPIDSNSGNVSDLDRTLTDHLRIRICPATERCDCAGSVVFTSRSAGHGPDFIKLQDEFYHVNWDVDKADKGDALDYLLFLPAMGTGVDKASRRHAFDLCFDVARLFVGSVGYTPNSNSTVPIKFRIDLHPTIRARALHEEGHSALQIAQVLRDEFALGEWDALLILKAEGFPLSDLYAVQTQVFKNSDVFAQERILRCLGFTPEQYLEYTARPTVEAFAPVLRFDGSWYGNGVPMSAQAYFQNIMQYNAPRTNAGKIWWTTPEHGPPCDAAKGIIPLPGRDDDDPAPCGMSNNNFSLLTSGQIPTYYRVISDENHQRLRVAYWWFYGWQDYCNSGIRDDGAHHGDWEHILVTTSLDRSRVDYVTYFFHGDWYTRDRGAFYVQGERPEVYVGKIGHGSYHSNQSPSCWMLGTPSHCCEYADCRNPNAGTWWYTHSKLVSLNGNSEPWMLADRVGSRYEYGGQQYEVISWRWGPVHDFCHSWFFDQCVDWGHSTGCGTHPTVDTLDWTLHSCDGEGCGTSDCDGLVYPTPAYFNRGWPWDN